MQQEFESLLPQCIAAMGGRSSTSQCPHAVWRYATSVPPLTILRQFAIVQQESNCPLPPYNEADFHWSKFFNHPPSQHIAAMCGRRSAAE